MLEVLVKAAAENLVPMLVGVVFGLLPLAAGHILAALKAAAKATPTKVDDELVAAIEKALKDRGAIQ